MNVTLTVPDRLRPWTAPWPDYRPVEITPDELRGPTAPDWAEPGDDPTVIDWPARQAAALIPFCVVDGRPRNPAGRTGRAGRNLRSWGENQAADPVVVAGDDAAGGLLVLLIRREDTHQWALPGGHVEPGETAHAALVRELREETGVDLADTVDPVVLARTLVDDPRATDESWIATTVALYRVAAPLATTAGSDALDVGWWPCDSIDGLTVALRAAGGALYPAHHPLLTTALTHLHRAAAPAGIGGEQR